ncbi:MAG: TolC family outer membrane protein [Proteobacteria bacterium]|nr:TolC family outer membrane protein [Pseudomonadota bacterium]
MFVRSGVSFAEIPSLPKLTLYSALAHAYQKNPDLEAARAQLRSVDESYIQAVAGFKPTVTAAAGYTSGYQTLNTGTAKHDPKTLSLAVTQSLYSGGSTVENVQASNNKIKAARAQLKSIEQGVLLDAIKAYMNMLSNQKIVQLRRHNESVLESHLKESQERYKLGDLTKTDVSQAESRLAKAKASRISAEGVVKKSRAIFEQVIGLSPVDLQKPELQVKLPETESTALELAQKNNPLIILARYSEDAARNTTRSIEGEKLPKIDLTGSLSKVYNPVDAASYDENNGSIGISATLPLYTGGSTSSRIRQSRQTENQLRMQTQSAERTVRESMIEAWEGLKAAVAESEALKVQIDAAQLALDGVKAELSYGSRTTLNLLDAEQEYLDAQVAYVGAEATRIIATYAILSAEGNLTAEDLHLDVPLYNVTTNFQNINQGGFGSDAAIFRGDFSKIRD